MVLMRETTGTQGGQGMGLVSRVGVLGVELGSFWVGDMLRGRGMIGYRGISKRGGTQREGGWGEWLVNRLQGRVLEDIGL